MDINADNPFVVTELTPRSRDGSDNRKYELTKQSAHPTRVVGRDDLGRPVEETVPTVYWKPFLMIDGCINKVPLRTGSVPSMHTEAVAYENETMYDLIIDGCIPTENCPYSTKHSHITRGPYVRIPEGESDCGGSRAEGGCAHMRALAIKRKAAVRADYDKREEEFSKMQRSEMERMREGIVAGVGEAMATHLAKMSPQQRVEAGRNRLREGKGEE
jgi:hypothetical protein